MAPSKRRTVSGPTAAGRSKPKSQSTLAFHGSSNKVTKPSTNVGKPKKDPTLLDEAIAGQIDVSHVDVKSEEEPTTAEVAIAEQAIAEAKAPVTEEDEKASKIGEAQIKKYWKEKEALRKAPRVHQEQLTLHEKVAREWDVDGRYGPCMGIARIKRWKRAQNLGLNPPIEVLAVLLKEQEANNIKAQTAQLDELMSSRFVQD